jgi:AcrR family transcriptional regulator
MNIIQYDKGKTMTTHALLDPLDKRQAILLAARELFAHQGYEETTIASIAKQANIAVGTVYLYFANKHDILVEVCIHLNAEIVGVLRSPDLLTLPLHEVPRTIIASIFHQSRERMRFMPYAQIEVQSPAEIQRLRDSKHAIVQSLDGFFQHIMQTQHLAPFATATYAALCIELLSGTLRQCFVIEQGEREEFYREGVIQFLERLFFGPPLVVAP